MAFPVEQTAATTTQTSNATAWGAQNMPSGIVAGDTLKAEVAVDGADIGITFTGGWTKLLDGATGSDGSVTLGVAYKKAVGSDTLSLTMSASQQGSCRVVRVDSAADPDVTPPEIGAVTTGASATPNVGAITPAGGPKDFKFYCLCAHDRDRSFTSAPTNYQANDATLSSGGANGAQLSWGDRDLNASTEDPDNFTYGTSDGFATVVLVVHPVPPPGPINAVLPISFAVTADLKAKGKLDAALATSFAIVADLDARGKLDAALPVSFNAVADLKAVGKLDATLPVALNVTADLKARGKLDATLPVIFLVTPDLKAKGKLDATLPVAFGLVANLTAASSGAIDAVLPLSFGVAADLKAQGKLDAALAMAITVAADLNATGELVAICAMAFSIIADLKADGQLNASPGISFGLAANLTSTGQLAASPAIAFNIAASLIDATAIPRTGGLELIGRTISIDLTGRVP